VIHRFKQPTIGKVADIMIGLAALTIGAILALLFIASGLGQQDVAPAPPIEIGVESA